MLHPPRPDVEQREQQQTQPRPAVVAAEVGARAAQSGIQAEPADIAVEQLEPAVRRDRKSTRLNSSHTVISYAVFCLKKKNQQQLADRLHLEEAARELL